MTLTGDSSLPEIINFINLRLDELYERDAILFERDLCERCLGFRFAHYLQSNLDNFNVDCDYNRSHKYEPNPDGTVSIVAIKGKFDIDEKGMYIDIIVHERAGFEGGIENGFICFELKKSNNYDRAKDISKLMLLTRFDKHGYGYKYGFHLILGRNREEVEIHVYQNGEKLSR